MIAFMPPPLDSPFFVFVIESNRPNEIHLSEGLALAKTLQFSGTPCEHFSAKHKSDVDVFLQAGAPLSLLQRRKLPILHFSAHGWEQGIVLTSGETVTWTELAVMLGPIADATAGNFVVAMSSCCGLHATQIPIFTDIKMYALIGTPVEVNWSDNVVAFTL